MYKKYNISITKAAKKLGIKPCMIYFRLHMGWPLEKAISEPVKKYNYKKIPEKEVFKSDKKYKTYDDSCFCGEKVYCDDYKADTSQRNQEITSVGGWRMVLLNHVKKGEHRFQAYNTDGRKYTTSDPIEIQCALDEIFKNICK